MNSTEAVIKRINELLKQRNMTAYRLADLCGLNRSTISNLLNNPKGKPQLSTIVRISFGFGISIKEFFDTDYFDECEEEVEDDID